LGAIFSGIWLSQQTRHLFIKHKTALQGCGFLLSSLQVSVFLGEASRALNADIGRNATQKDGFDFAPAHWQIQVGLRKPSVNPCQLSIQLQKIYARTLQWSI
jgi:hypothetical protein